MEAEAIQEYWAELSDANVPGRKRAPAKGPIHEMHRTLGDWGIETRGPAVWKVDGKWTKVRPGPEFTRLAQQSETDRQWANLGRTRYNFHGLQSGRDHALS